MEKLTQKRVELLDKLFNLSTNESTIICDIKAKIDSYIKEEEKTTKEKEEHEKERKKLETELLTFSSQAKEFLSHFGNYNNSSFEKLRNIDIDLEIGTIVNKIKKSVPDYERELNKEIKEEVNGISNCTKKLKELSNLKEEANNDLSDSISLKDRLSNLLEDILVNNNIASYTRGFIKKILTELDEFSEEEENELEFLILFPESGLKLYHEYKKNPYPLDNDKKEDDPKEAEVQPVEVEEEPEVPSSVEIDELEKILEETKEEKPTIDAPTLAETMQQMAEEKTVIEVKPVTEAPTLAETMQKMQDEKDESFLEVLGPTLAETMKKMEEEKDAFEIETTSEAPTLAETMQKMQEENTEVEEAKEYVYDEEDSETNKVVEEIKQEDEFQSKLSDIGIDVNAIDITYRDKVIEKLKNTEEKVLRNNYELLKAIEVDNECLYDIDSNDYMYLTDKELTNKITIIRSKGIKDTAIKNALVNSGLKMSVDTLGDRIKSIENSNKELKESNLYMLEIDLANIDHNIAKLTESGIELDAKEKRNYMTVLARCKNIDGLINVLTTYVVNLSKRNGKFELNVLLYNTKELLLCLDYLIEQGLEDQIAETPEIFNYNIDMLLSRIAYCKEKNIPIYSEDDNLINDYIYDAQQFAENFPDAQLEKIQTREECNKALDSAISDSYASKLIETLDEYYNKFDDIELIEPDNKSLYEKLLSSIESELKITNVGKNTCKFKDLFISRNKLEKNLTIIASKYIYPDEILENLRTTIIVAALYNIRSNNIKEIVSKCFSN